MAREGSFRSGVVVVSEAVPCNKRNSSLKGLPGTGEKSSRCNGWFAPRFCSECGELLWRKGNCKRALCPDCSTRWRFGRAESIAKRLYSFALEKGKKGKRLRHFTVSPSDYWVEKLEEDAPVDLDIDYLFREAMKTVRWKTRDESGGGVIIYHPYRLIDEGKRKAKQLKQEKENMAPGKAGDWKAILTLDNWKDFVEFSPHFHVIVEIDKGKNWKEGFKEKDGGFIWEGIRDVNKGSDVYKLAMYLLSHAGILDGKMCIRWFGDVSTNKWKFEDAKKGIQVRVEDELEGAIETYEKAENFSVKTCAECDGDLVDIRLVPEYLDQFEGEVGKKLFAVYLMQSSNKDPPESLGTEEEVEDWLKEEYEEVFSEGSIFDGVSPSGLRKWVVSMPEEVKRNVRLRKKFWTDPQKVLRHFEKSSKPKYYGRTPKGKIGGV